MDEFPPQHTLASYEITTSPETDQEIPVLISSWTPHADPDDPDQARMVQARRALIAKLRMHELMQHELLGDNGQATTLDLSGTTLKILDHPAVRYMGDFPQLPDTPQNLGHAVVTGGMGMYILVAIPTPGPPTLAQLERMTPGRDYGMGRIAVAFDAAAAAQYAESVEDRQLQMLAETEDPSLVKPLQFLLGLEHPPRLPRPAPWRRIENRPRED